jgi:hypothetical protein
MAKADDRCAVLTHPVASRYEKRNPCELPPPSVRLPDNWTVIDPRAPATTRHVNADQVERINITDAGSDSTSRPQESRIGSLAVPISRWLAPMAPALHIVATQATEMRIVKGPVDVLVATPYA